jgi:hypothetical protein
MSIGASKARMITGWVLHGLIAASLILAGAAKAFKLSAEMVKGLEEVGKLGSQVTTIGVGAMACGILLLIPRTMSIGLLLTCSYWGGAILMHMIKGESYALIGVFLAMTWAGAFLRDSRTLGGLAK